MIGDQILPSDHVYHWFRTPPRYPSHRLAIGCSFSLRNRFQSMSTHEDNLRKHPTPTTTVTQAFLATTASFHIALSFRPLVFAVAKDGSLHGFGDEHRLTNGTNPLATNLQATLPLHPVNIHLPVGVGTPENPIVEVSAMEHVLALSAKGDIIAWGDNSRAQLGTFFRPIRGAHFQSIPTTVFKSTQIGNLTMAPSFQRYISVRAGHYFSLALTADGHVVAWGWNRYNQTGRWRRPRTPIEMTIRPRRIRVLKDIVAIDVGLYFAVAVDRIGRLFVWGNWTGHFEEVEGDEFHPLEAFTVQHYPLPGRVIQASCGHFHTVVLLENGRVFTFGRNDVGQLGVEVRGRKGRTRSNSAIHLTMIPPRTMGAKLKTLLRLEPRSESEGYREAKQVVAIKACRFINLSLAQTKSNEVYVWGDSSISIRYFEQLAYGGQLNEWTKQARGQRDDVSPRVLPFSTIQEAEFYLLKVYAAIDLEFKNVCSSYLVNASVEHRVTCDVRFTFGPNSEQLFAHSHLLRMLSARWVAILDQHDRNESGYYELDYSPHASKTFKHYLDFIFTGNLEVANNAQLVAVDELAETLKCTELAERCDQLREAILELDLRQTDWAATTRQRWQHQRSFSVGQWNQM